MSSPRQQLLLLVGMMAAVWSAPAAMATPAPGPVSDVASAAGIRSFTQSLDVVPGDVNLDGRPDLLVTRHSAGVPLLYMNVGGRFASPDAALFSLRVDVHSCAWGDVNVDGRPDLYCVIGASHGTAVKSNRLWIQKADGTFKEQAAAYGVQDPYGRGRAAVFLDVNHDRYPDLFVMNNFQRPDAVPSTNRLYMNDGGTRFHSAPEYGVDKELGGQWIMPGGLRAVDVDGDGWTDLVVCARSGIRLYRNVDGTHFADATKAWGLSGNWLDARVADFNRDGRLDIALISPTSFQVQLQKSGGGFATASVRRSVNEGRSLAMGDVNFDGYPDVYLLTGGGGNRTVPNPPDTMLINDGGTAFHTVPIPETSKGWGGWVEPVDYDGNGTTDFVVANGANDVAGPIQLISFARPARPALPDQTDIGRRDAALTQHEEAP